MSQFIRQLKRELAAIVKDKAVLVTVVGGIVFYAALYPQPYLNNLPEDLSIAAVDLDNSATSRKLLRWANASPKIRISYRSASVAAARELLTQGLVRGLIVIPYDFEKDLAVSKSPVVGLAGDANYFLVYGTAMEGLVGAVKTVSAGARVRGMMLEGAPMSFAIMDWSPIKLNARPLFNVSMGYLGYVLPAVFVLILHQTMLLASGLIGAGSYKAGSTASSNHPHIGVGVLLGARFCAMFLIYLLLTQFYMGVCFEFYGVPRNADLNDLWLMIVAFIAATAALGVLIGVVLPRRELVAPFVMMSSLPLAFTAGFIWPVELIPEPIVWLTQMAPSTSAIQGFLKLNQMGASIAQVANHWWALVGLAVLYGLLAYKLLQRRYANQPGTLGGSI
jgi:ABC-2 type transport system permease protein